MTRRLVLLLLLVLCVFPTENAFATNYLVRFCATYSVDYDDASTSVGDDFWTDNTDKPARGARIRIKRNSDGVDMYYNYTDWLGLGTACTGNLLLSSTQTYLVRMYSQSKIDGNYIDVRNDPTNNLIFTYDAYTAFAPTQSSTYVINTGIENAWNILATASYAQYTERGGLTGVTYTLYDEECSSGGSCTGSDGKVWISDVGAGRKYIIGHELGHSVALSSTGSSGSSFSYSATLDKLLHSLISQP